MAQTFDLEVRLLEFGARIVRVTESLPKSPAGRHIAGQLMRAGTSPLAQHGEAQAVESRRDFIHKIRIGLKELRETRRWLLLIQRVPLIKKPTLLEALLLETDELTRIFVASIKTAENEWAKK